MLQENATEKQYSQNYFFRDRNSTTAETPTKSDTNLYLIRHYLPPNNSEVFRFSPYSEKLVHFLQGGLLDIVTE